LFPEHWSGTNDFDTKENATVRHDKVDVENSLYKPNKVRLLEMEISSVNLIYFVRPNQEQFRKMQWMDLIFNPGSNEYGKALELEYVEFWSRRMQLKQYIMKW
jgi:hypothetical protein